MPRHFFLFSSIFSGEVERLVSQLLAYDRENSDEITIFINSPGGGVSSALAIIDVMNIIKSPIRTVVVGQASSAAAVIACMGDTRLITEHSKMMIHEVWGMMIGSTSEMDEAAKSMKADQDKILSLISKKTGKSVAELEALQKGKDKYFKADEAVAFGLVDKIIKNSESPVLKLSEKVDGEAFEVNEFTKEIQLFREGEFEHPTYGTVSITPQVLSRIVENFNARVRGVDISIDYTHDNESGEDPAAFWINGLELRNTSKGLTLFASGEFTPIGLKKVLEKEYKYASADFCIDYVDESGRHIPYVLRGGTLTNRPFIKGMSPIKLSEKKEIKRMDREQLLLALKNLGIDVVNIQAEYETMKTENSNLKAKIQEINNLPSQKDEEIKALKGKVSELNQSIVDNAKLASFNTLVEAGKVTPAQKDKILKTFNTVEDMTEFYKDAQPVVNMKPHSKEDGVVGGDLTEPEQELINMGKYTKEQILKYRKQV